MTHSSKKERTCRHCGVALTGLLADYTHNPAFPFCSARCRMADLGQWFSDAYAISQSLDELDEDQREELQRGDIPIEPPKDE